MVNGLPILQQLGLETPDARLFTALSVAIGGATAVGTARTLLRLTGGDMTVGELRRYAKFFGLNAEQMAAKDAEAMKRSGDFTSADSLAAIDAAKAEGTLADSVLAAEGAAATAPPPAAPYVSPAVLAAEAEAAYARQVELTNGRWAMLGFAAAILIEASTGMGIVSQLEFYCKGAGLLGANSGF